VVAGEAIMTAGINEPANLADTGEPASLADTGEPASLADTGEPASLADIALRRARRSADAPFVLTLGDPDPSVIVTRTYGQMAARGARLAEVLADLGVSPGEAVGCYLGNSPSWVVASLGVWWHRCMVAAVGTLLPSSEADRLFQLAGVKTVVSFADAPRLPDSYRVVAIDSEGILEGEADPGATRWQTTDLALPDPDDVALAIFTSGTTGRPKGITHTHRDVLVASRRVAANYARNADYRPDPAPPHLPPGVIFNPFGHMAGYNRLGFRLWIGRPSLVVPRFTVPAVRALLASFPMDTMQLTPTMIHMLATTDEPLDLSSVKYVTSGTAPLPIATRERFEQRYGVPVMQAYGMSETGGVATERYDDVVAGRRGPGSVGRIADGVEVRIRRLDDDRPEGEGEILVRSDEVTDAFIGGDPVPVDDEGFFATGDIGRLTDGILYITGRVQEKIIVGGFNVYPAEVEDVARRSALVRDVVVVSVPDDRLGELPVAGVVWAGEPDEAALLAEMRGELAHYKVPRAVFPLDAVPLTAREKVDRRRAAELARAALGGDR
jgi:long-chain acyl-CoA synthetase